MKKTILAIATLFLSLGVLSPLSFAQCNAMQHKKACTAQLADGFTFIKSYVLEEGKINANGEIEYSFVFSKGTLYMLTLANSAGEAKGVEITLYDPARKKLVSNFDGTNYHPIGYPCRATGVHYMTFKFKDGETPCGLSVLGFKRP